MATEKIGNQTIACSVSSCRYNDGCAYCSLSRIEVQPCSGCKNHTGKPADESLCGSYRTRIGPGSSRRKISCHLSCSGLLYS